jgi:hypothetical protein
MVYKPIFAKHHAAYGSIAANTIVPSMVDETGDYDMNSVITPTITAKTGSALTIAGADGYDVKVTLGDDDATESFIVEEVDGDDLFKVGSTGLVTLKGGAAFDNVTSATELNITETTVKVTGNLKHIGEFSTRNAADNSMYTAVAASSGHERLMKVAAKVTSNDGGYFDAGYFNASTSGAAATGGEIRGIEAKATVLDNMDAGAIATGVYAKVNVSGASAEVATGIGVDVLLEEESSGTLTKGIGVRVQGGVGAINYAIDASGLYATGALNLPYGSTNGIAAANFATGFGIAEAGDNADNSIVGFYENGSDNKTYLVCKVAGLYKYVEVSDAS